MCPPQAIQPIKQVFGVSFTDNDMAINIANGWSLSNELYHKLISKNSKVNAIFPILLHTKSCPTEYTLLTRQSTSVLKWAYCVIMKLIKED